MSRGAFLGPTERLPWLLGLLWLLTVLIYVQSVWLATLEPLSSRLGPSGDAGFRQMTRRRLPGPKLPGPSLAGQRVRGDRGPREDLVRGDRDLGKLCTWRPGTWGRFVRGDRGPGEASYVETVDLGRLCTRRPWTWRGFVRGDRGPGEAVYVETVDLGRLRRWRL
jgi:hypothetical protein